MWYLFTRYTGLRHRRVRVRDRGREWLPTADTCLEAHMRITALIAPEAHAGLPMLRQGCAAIEVEMHSAEIGTAPEATDRPMS